MKKIEFEPFQDRLSRDIRNNLSSTFGAVLRGDTKASVNGVAQKYLDHELASCYVNYIKQRLKLYNVAFKNIEENFEDDVIAQSLVLWNLGLIFEVHEVLEHGWYHAKGERKLVLQALIRSAGVFIKREYGYEKQAMKIGAKAIPILQSTAILSPYFDKDRLIASIVDSVGKPPQLY